MATGFTDSLPVRGRNTERYIGHWSRNLVADRPTCIDLLTFFIRSPIRSFWIFDQSLDRMMYRINEPLCFQYATIAT